MRRRRNAAVVEQVVLLVAPCLLLGMLQVLPGHSAMASSSAAGSRSNVALRAMVIPIGFQGAKYSAMIQIAVNGSPLPDATWEFDSSFISVNRKLQEFSGRVVAEEPDTPVVFEVQVEFEPGPYTLMLWARETTAGQSETRKLNGLWPDPKDRPATVSPVVLLQPARGAFLRGKNARGQSALAIGDDNIVRTELPTAVVSVVCRDAALRGLVRIERKLEGESSVEFKPIELQAGDDPCAQVRDIIPPGTLGVGHFRYQVRVMTDSGEIASGERKFAAVRGSQGSRPGS
jgi:hypothetical protein